MKNKKQKKLKPLAKIILSIIILIFVFGIGYIIIDHVFYFELIGDKTVEVDINKKYLENGAIAKFFNKKIDDIKITNNINTKKLGEYKVKYTAKAFIFKKHLQRKVIVKDKEKPEIKLKGEKTIYLNIGEKYKEPGFSCIDNVDGDITKKVKVTDNIDSNKVGKYKVTYKAIDSSKNENIVEREVEVIKADTVLKASMADFSLEGLFSEVVLEYNAKKEYNYFKDTVFLGDSNTVYLYQKGKYISAKQAWGKLNMNIAQINSSTFTTFENNSSSTLNNALKTYKPKYLIVSIGIDTTLHMNKENFMKESQSLIDNIKKNYPDTTLILNATFPVYPGSINGNHQVTINHYNYYLLEMCYKNKISFINFSDKVKGKDGYAVREYFECSGTSDCGFHLNEKGKEYYIDYIKHLDLGRKYKWKKY